MSFLCSYDTLLCARVFLYFYKIGTDLKNCASDYTGAEPGHHLAPTLSGSRICDIVLYSILSYVEQATG